MTVAVHGHVGPTGCPRSHRWCLRRHMLVSVLQDQPRAVGISPKHPTCQSLHKTTYWSRQRGPGKVPGTINRKPFTQVKSMLGMREWGHQPFILLCTTSHPHFTAHRGGAEGPRPVEHQKQGSVVRCGAGTSQHGALGWVLKKPDMAGLEARPLCPALTPLSPKQIRGAAGSTLASVLVWHSQTSSHLQILM